MREDLGLHRGRRKDGGGWVKGYYFEREERSFIMTDSYPLDEDCDSTPMRIIAVEVMPETVGLCSGVPDRKGVKIFEGDIIHAVTLNSNGYFEVKFGYGQFYIGLNMPAAYVRSSCEVIGNIFDNPELLNVEKAK